MPKSLFVFLLLSVSFYTTGSILNAQSTTTVKESVVQCYAYFKKCIVHHDNDLLLTSIDKESISYFKETFKFLKDSTNYDKAKLDKVQLFMLSHAYFSYSKKYRDRLELSEFIIMFYNDLSRYPYKYNHLDESRIVSLNDSVAEYYSYQFIKEDDQYRFSAKHHLSTLTTPIINTKGRIDPDICSTRKPPLIYTMPFSEELRKHLDYNSNVIGDIHYFQSKASTITDPDEFSELMESGQLKSLTGVILRSSVFDFSNVVPDELFDIDSLILLDVHSLDTIEISEKLSAHKSLKYLRLPKLKTYPSILNQLINIETLDIHIDNMDELPEFVFSLPKLRALSVWSENGGLLSDQISLCKNLQILRLSVDYGTVSLPSSFDQLKSLKHASMGYLSNNQLAMVLKLPELESIDIYKANLESLGKDANYLKKIKRLNLSKVTGLHQINQCTELAYLEISGNASDSSLSVISDIYKLRCAIIRGDRIHNLPLFIKQQEQLEYLDLTSYRSNISIDMDCSKLLTLKRIHVYQKNNEKLPYRFCDVPVMISKDQYMSNAVTFEFEVDALFDKYKDILYERIKDIEGFPHLKKKKLVRRYLYDLLYVYRIDRYDTSARVLRAAKNYNYILTDAQKEKLVIAFKDEAMIMAYEVLALKKPN